MSIFSIQEYLKNNPGIGACLAQHFGISRAAISQWQEVPIGRVLGVEEITGISRHELRPDIYGPKPEKAA